MFELLAVRRGKGDGQSNLRNGDSQLGYYGRVNGSNFISLQDLAVQTGVPAASVLNANPAWLKFAYKGKTLYVAQLPYRNLISWNQLSGYGVIDGTKTVQVNGRVYKVRLIEGLAGGEWDQLMYRISANDPTGTFWERLSDADICVGSTGGNGRTTWTQDASGNGKIYRGYASITDSQVGQPTSSTVTTGWRPVLELVS